MRPSNKKHRIGIRPDKITVPTFLSQYLLLEFGRESLNENVLLTLFKIKTGW